MDVEKSSKASGAFHQAFSALFGTVLVFSLILSIAEPQARPFSGCLLAAYLVKAVVRVINSENRRDECWQIAREIGFAARVLVWLAVVLAAIFVVARIALRP